MGILSARIAVLICGIIGTVCPFIIWGALYIVVRRLHVNLHPLLPWLRAIEWIAWLAAVVLMVLALAKNRTPVYAWPCFVFMGGLKFVERWVIRNFAPEEMPIESGDGWWPSKPE